MTSGRQRRILCVAPPFVAHVNPIASIAVELIARGHDVAWVTYPSMQRLLPTAAKLYAVPEDQAYAEVMHLMGAHTTRFLAEGFMFFYRDVVLPLSRAMQSHIEAAIEDFKPDAMVVDHHALAGALSARRHNLPWATSSPSGQSFVDLDAALPSANSWLQSLLEGLQVEYGLKPVPRPDTSPDLVLLYTTRALTGEKPLPPEYQFVGPAIDQRPDQPEFPWHALAPGRRVLVSLGSIHGRHAQRFFSIVVEALKDLPIQVVVSDPTGQISDPPDNFLVQRWLPQLQLLPHVDAMITHGGSTVNEALAFGVPMVVAPIAWDNFVYAALVAQAGAGIRVRFGRTSAAELRDATLQVLDNLSYRLAAGRIRDSYKAAGGTKAVADALIALVP